MNLQTSPSPSVLTVKRCHGIGNVVMLLPVLDRLAEQGKQVHLVTQPEWVETLREFRPSFKVDDRSDAHTIDLDAATESLKPVKHRSEEFADLLGVTGALDVPRISVNEEWSRPFQQWRGAIGFAPEAGHPSREWPLDYAIELAKVLEDSPLVLIGAKTGPAIPCALDTRGQLDLKGLCGLLATLRLLICMDSGILHIGAAIGVPTICIFGGVDPRFRIAAAQPVIALQARLDCCPCNKLETCHGSFDCIKAISPRAVLDAIEESARITERTIRLVV